MIIILALIIIIFSIIKVINYGRWAGNKGNLRGAIGLYLMALLSLLIPTGVYAINSLR